MELSSKEIEVLDRLEYDTACQRYFFDHVKDLKWFYRLKDRQWFNPENIKWDKGTNNSCYFWQPLLYLEKVANQIDGDPQNEETKKCAEEILNIIDEVVVFSHRRQEEGQPPVNNYHIWWYLVKILHKLPNGIIKNQVLPEKFKIWMYEFANPSMAGNLSLSAVSETIRLWLPKFLNEEMKAYADIVIKAITRMAPSEKKRSFIRQEDAQLTFLDRWRWDEFSKTADKIGRYCDQETIRYLLDQLRMALEFRTREQSCTFKVKEEFFRVTLNRVKQDGLGADEIGFQEGVFSGVIQKYTKDDLTEINLDDEYAVSRKDPTGKDKRAFNLPDVKDTRAFQKAFMDLCSKGDLKDLTLDKADDFEKKAGYLYEAFFTDYSYIWFSKLDEPQGCLGSRAHDILSILCSKILLAKCEYDAKTGKNLIHLIIREEKHKFSIFGRMVLRILDKLWDDQYGNIFNKDFLDAYPALFEGSAYELELSELFKHHAENFSPTVATALRERIQSPPQWYQQKSVEENDDNIVRRWQFEWVAFLKDAEGFKSWYDELKKYFPDDPEPVVRSGLRRVGWVKDNSPKTKDELLGMNVADIVKFLGEFEGAKNTWELSEGKPSQDGLANEFKLAVKDNPEKFVQEVSLFRNVSLRYTIALIKGFQDAWQANHDFAWKAVLSFSQEYIKNHKTDKEKSSGRFDYARSCRNFTEEVARLIGLGSKDEHRAFENDAMLDEAGSAFETIFREFPIAEQREGRKDSSAMNYAINTPIGRIIENFFLFSMHVKRVSPAHNIVQGWGENKYNQFFEGIDEGYIYFGRYLPNMCFLDKGWAHEKVKEINGFDVADQHWKDFMEGYLSGSSVYKDLYELLRPSYEKAIKNKLVNDQIDDNLARHITLGYLRDYEILREDFDGENTVDEKGLFELMLKDANTEEKQSRWGEIVEFMWSCAGKHESDEKNDDLPDNVKKKILAFWNWTFEKREFVKKQLGQEKYELFLSRISLLTIILPYVSDDKGKYKTKSWLMECAKHVEKEHYSSFLIEYFLNFTKDDDRENIGVIYKEILNSGRTPIYKKEDIELLIDRIYGVDFQTADDIVEIYARDRGQFFLRGLWQKWHQKESKLN
jgi:hypothetical protein